MSQRDAHRVEPRENDLEMVATQVAELTHLVEVDSEDAERGKCLLSYAPSAEKTQKFHLILAETDQYTALTVIEHKELR